MVILSEELQIRVEIERRRRIGPIHVHKVVPGVRAGQVDCPAAAVGKVAAVGRMDPQGAGRRRITSHKGCGPVTFGRSLDRDDDAPFDTLPLGPLAGRDVDPADVETTRRFLEIQADGAAVGEVERIGYSGTGGCISFVLYTVVEQVVRGLDLPRFDERFQLAGGLDRGNRRRREPQAGIGPVESRRRGAADDMTPESFQAVAVVAITAGVGAVGLDRVERSGLTCDMGSHPLEIIPMFLAPLLVVLRDVREVIPLGMVQRPLVLVGFEVPGIPHFGDADFLARLRGATTDVARPVRAPGLLAGGLVVHAVEDVTVLERVREHLVHKSLLVLEDDGVVPLVRRGEEKRLFVRACVVGVVLREARLFVGVVDVVLRIVRMRFPVLCGVVEAVPDLDLHDDVPLGGPAEQVLEAPPVFVVPLVEVVLAVGALGERIDLEALVPPVAHRVADVVAAGCLDLVEVLLEVGDLEQVVVLAAAQQQDGPALVLPVAGILGPRPDAARVIGTQHGHLNRRGEGQDQQQQE